MESQASKIQTCSDMSKASLYNLRDLCEPTLNDSNDALCMTGILKYYDRVSSNDTGQQVSIIQISEF
jgi:hypothetical protein